MIIFGSFSGRNKGDLGILRSELKLFKGQEIHIFTKRPRVMKKYLKDFNVKIHHAFTGYWGLMTIPQIIKADKIIIGGGGLFFERRLWNPFYNHVINLFFLSVFFRLFRKKVYVLAVGADEMKSELARWMLSYIVNSAKRISARDEYSALVIKQYTPLDPEIVSDPALLLNIDEIPLPMLRIAINKLTEYSKEEFVLITSKLHGAIFAYIAGIKYMMRNPPRKLLDFDWIRKAGLIEERNRKLREYVKEIT